MAQASPSRIRPFDARTFGFLKELAKHNDRDWFESNRDRYENHVLEPALAFIEAMGPRLRRISGHFLAVPKRTGGSLMRVHRDMRFSRDGQPYKTNIGIQFRHERARDVHAPGFYVHIEPGRSFVGAGSWRPEPAALAAIRREILEQPALWRKATRSRRFSSCFALTGDSLKRPPKGIAAESPDIEDLKRKDFVAIVPLTAAELTRGDTVTLIEDRFRRARPFMAFLCGALDLQF